MKTRAAPSDDGPSAGAVPDVTTSTLVGICVGGLLFVVSVAVVAYFCYKKRGERLGYKPRSDPEKNAPDKPLVPRKPSAVKSPNGGPARPVLRKSSGPPGPGNSPLGRRCPPEDGETEKRDPCKNTGRNTEAKRTAAFPENDKEQKEEKDNRETEREENEKNKLGKLHFELKYDAEKSSLLVTICKCTDLPPKDRSAGTCDPYVKLQLLPEKQYRVKTRVLRKTVDPVYGEDFTFYGIGAGQLRALTLHFVVLGFDRYSRDDVIGEVVRPLSEVEMEKLKKRTSFCEEIAPRNWKLRAQGHGELLVSLCHQPASNRLTVVVLKARNLPKLDVAGLCDPYVKIYLLYNNQRIAKKKTHVKKRTVNPVFNESFLFEVPFNEGLSHVGLEFLLLDWDRVTKNEVIGRLEMGRGASGSALDHWLEACSSPRRQIAQWHKLGE
ncbi:synaptotagmin-4-like [Centruroides vittatus]|uniref:synaptotagmin-4-like n=1 Tax=Centruroides vittatus TaxID=120091 RepID=UPI00350F09A4